MPLETRLGLGNWPDSYASTVGYTATVAALGILADAWDGGVIDPGWADLAALFASAEKRLTGRFASWRRERRRCSRRPRRVPAGQPLLARSLEAQLRLVDAELELRVLAEEPVAGAVVLARRLLGSGATA
jgi:hypothetical protein